MNGVIYVDQLSRSSCQFYCDLNVPTISLCFIIKLQRHFETYININNVNQAVSLCNVMMYLHRSYLTKSPLRESPQQCPESITSEYVVNLTPRFPPGARSQEPGAPESDLQVRGHPVSVVLQFPCQSRAPAHPTQFSPIVHLSTSAILPVLLSELECMERVLYAAWTSAFHPHSVSVIDVDCDTCYGLAFPCLCAH